MATPLAQLLAGIPTLNRADQPFEYTVDGETIVGCWDRVKGVAIIGEPFQKMDFSYSLRVTFDQHKERFGFVERNDTHVTGQAIQGGYANSKSTFRGKTFSSGKSWTSGGAPAPTGAAFFTTAAIKDPLFNYLKQNGWKSKSRWFQH